MFDGRTIFDGFATVKNFGDRILNFPARSSQVKNPAKNKASKRWQLGNLPFQRISTAAVEKDLAARFRLAILGLNQR
jgi:hypothetical protein